MTALLFFDSETTGLTVSDTILETAWTITDLDGTLRVPLRSRFCEISRNRPVVPMSRSTAGEPVWDDDSDPGWHPSDPVACKMAVDSGLFDAWLACPDTRRLKTGPELERLILDDVVGFTSPGEVVHIAGSGVAQFDQPLLRVHCPGLVYPQGAAGGPVHYRPVDQSGALTSLLGESNESKTTALIAWYLRYNGGTAADIELGMRPQYAYGDDVPMAWLTGERGKHRAAPDVARAVVAQRALWAYGASLRTDLGTK
jgi:hypothetical protein